MIVLLGTASELTRSIPRGLYLDGGTIAPFIRAISI